MNESEAFTKFEEVFINEDSGKDSTNKDLIEDMDKEFKDVIEEFDETEGKKEI